MIKINGHPLIVYQKNDVWRGGMVAFGRAERCLDGDGPRRLVKTTEVSGYHQSEYLLEEQNLIVTWEKVNPEIIGEIVGPEPSRSWAKGTITTTAGNRYQLEYKLAPQTKEQAEKVFRERLIDQAGKKHTTTDQMNNQLRGLQQTVTEVAQRLAEKEPANLAEKVAREAEPTPEYVFRRRGTDGDFWQIVFEGRELPPVRHLAGMTYLRALLARPGHAFAALDLYEIENPPPPEAVARNSGEGAEIAAEYGTGGRAQTHLEGQTPSNLRKAKAALEAKIEANDLSERQRDHLEKQIEAIDSALSACRVAKNTGGATFENAEKKQPRQAVSKAIDKAIDALTESPALMKHLAAAVRKGSTLSYAGRLAWET